MANNIINTYIYFVIQGFGDFRILDLLLTCVGHHQYEVGDRVKHVSFHQLLLETLPHHAILIILAGRCTMVMGNIVIIHFISIPSLVFARCVSVSTQMLQRETSVPPHFVLMWARGECAFPGLQFIII